MIIIGEACEKCGSHVLDSSDHCPFCQNRYNEHHLRKVKGYRERKEEMIQAWASVALKRGGPTLGSKVITALLFAAAAFLTIWPLIN